MLLAPKDAFAAFCLPKPPLNHDECIELWPTLFDHYKREQSWDSLSYEDLLRDSCHHCQYKKASRRSSVRFSRTSEVSDIEPSITLLAILGPVKKHHNIRFTPASQNSQLAAHAWESSYLAERSESGSGRIGVIPHVAKCDLPPRLTI